MNAVIYFIRAVPTGFNHQNWKNIPTVKGTQFLLKPQCAIGTRQSLSIHQSTQHDAEKECMARFTRYEAAGFFHSEMVQRLNISYTHPQRRKMIFMEIMFEEVGFCSLCGFCLSNDGRGCFLTSPRCLDHAFPGIPAQRSDGAVDRAPWRERIWLRDQKAYGLRYLREGTSELCSESSPCCVWLR